MKASRLFLILVCILLLPVFKIQAQLTPSDAINELNQNVSIKVTPENPAPDSSILITIDSYSVDLDSSNITWLINDKVIKEETGGKTITTQTGSSNTSINIEIKITPLGGAEFSKTITLKPASVDLLWAGKSYTPPFYKGLSLYTKQNTILLVAIPNNTNSSGALIKPENFIYTWSKDGTVLGSLSGYGKNTLSMTDSILGQPMKISVVATNTDKSFTAENSIYISPTKPFILFYENSPLYGLRTEYALTDNFIMKDKEINVVGLPFYYAKIDTIDGSLKYSWSLNNTKVESSYNNYITLRQNDASSGESLVSLKVENPKRILQNDSKNLNIKYNNESNL